MAVTRRERYIPKRPIQAWSMDFLVGRRLRAEQVVEACNRLVASRGSPVRIFVDNDSDFSGRAFDHWVYHRKAAIDFNRPGKPTDNCFVGTFNGAFRGECLNVHWFETIDDARAKLEAWRVEYNESRHHQALKDLTPAEFAGQARHLVTSEEFSNAEKLAVRLVLETQALQIRGPPSVDVGATC
jgi:putative transposase